MPGIVTNPETGEVRAVIDPSAPSPDAPTPAEPAPAGAPDATDPAQSPWLLLSPEFAAARYEEIRAASLADPLHPLRDDRSPDHERAIAEYLGLQERMAGRNPDDPGDPSNKVIGEQMAHTSILRPPGADALSPAPRPELPQDSGMQWDEPALREGEGEAHACGLPSHTVMTVTADLAAAVEQAEARGAGWSAELGAVELVRRHGAEGADRMADRARIAYELILELDAPRLVQRARELGRDHGDDPNVIAAFAALYTEIINAPPSSRLEALLLRRTERAMQAEAKARAEAETIRRAHDAEGDEARAASLAGVALAHRRWGKSEP